MKYKTKPFEINAVQFTGDNWDELVSFAGTNVRRLTETESLVYIGYEVYDYQHQIWIPFYIKNYIIKGINGEYYPCVPDIFEAKYESN